jgi:hypothetical protein
MKDGIEFPPDDCDDVAAGADAGGAGAGAGAGGTDYGFGGNTLIDDGNPHINKILTTLFLSLFHYHKSGTNDNGGGTFCNIRLF